MKRLAIITILITISLSSFAQDKIIPKSELPKEIISYIKLHFPKNSIIQASIGNEVFSKSYEIMLEDNFNLDFSSKGKITDIEGITKLPKSVIPKQILKYVKTNYPKNVIISWELDDKNQEVKLNNGIELEFNMNGAFLRIDK